MERCWRKRSRRCIRYSRTGVGGGIVAGGNLIHGVSGAGGEIGHITADPEGFECTCGKRGCLETVSSATGVVRLGRSYRRIRRGFKTESNARQRRRSNK